MYNGICDLYALSRPSQLLFSGPPTLFKSQSTLREQKKCQKKNILNENSKIHVTKKIKSYLSICFDCAF